MLRSKSADLVMQEIWGHRCCHYAIRTLMWEAADHANVDPGRVSFVAALRIVRRSFSAARDFSLSACTRLATRDQVARQRLNPARRRRANPRVIKRKYIKWHVTRARHRDWRRPTQPTKVMTQPLN